MYALILADPVLFLSTLSLRRATFKPRIIPDACGQFLSTLSLRRATCAACRPRQCCRDFYPRSPCGERLEEATARLPGGLFLSTLSLRRATPLAITSDLSAPFLSTLSLRRATVPGRVHIGHSRISIHALLAESDARSQSPVNIPRIFLSTLSLRRATILAEVQQQHACISIHALLAESDRTPSAPGWALG